MDKSKATKSQKRSGRAQQHTYAIYESAHVFPSVDRTIVSSVVSSVVSGKPTVCSCLVDVIDTVVAATDFMGVIAPM